MTIFYCNDENLLASSLIFSMFYNTLEVCNVLLALANHRAVVSSLFIHKVSHLAQIKRLA
jgi:hypothetical protein